MSQRPPSLVDKVALVTGASRGIGRAIAQRLASAGATVVVTARSFDRAPEAMPGTLQETVTLIEQAGGRALPLGADLENAADRADLVHRVARAADGRLDILVNNAGFAHYATIDRMSLETFDLTIDHYLRTPFVLSKAALPYMRAHGAGWIVNIGSAEAQPPPKPYHDHAKSGGGNVYGAIKAALARFTQGLAAELLSDDIAVNLVAPSSAISTPGADRLIPAGFPTERVEYLAETVLAMCHRPAAERTGLVAHSMHFPHHHELAVYSLDGRTSLPPAVLPPWSHPLINGSGEYP